MLSFERVWRAAGVALLASVFPGCVPVQTTDMTSQQAAQQPRPLMDSGVKANKDKAPEIDPTRTEERDDVFEIASLLPNNPWLHRGGKVVGLKVPAYFVSGTTRKGTFVPGTILAWVYGFERDAAGATARTPLHIWEFPRDQAMNFRVRKKSIMGFPYQFYLTWPDELDLRGQYIELELGYEQASNKRVIVSPPKRLRVPTDDVPLPPGTPVAATRKGA